MAVIQAFSRERAFLDEFDKANDANRRTNTYAQWLNSLFFPGIEFLGIVAMASVLWVGGRLLEHGSLTIGTLVSAVFLLNLVFQPLQELSDLYGQVQSAGAAMEKISLVLDTEPEIHDEPGARPPARIEGDLHIDRVSFSYGRDPVLHEVDIHVPAGGCLALVGESGGGKSTTAKLVGRFYDPDEGAIRVDGVDLRELELRAYRRQLGVVLQDPFLFAGTLADNVRFARPEATDEMVADVARAVGVERIARRFERGLLHEVREGGAGLSAGERQLISIARALAGRPAHPDLRRGDVEHRPPGRGADRARARPAAPRPHVDHHRAPPRHRPPRGRDRRARARPHRAAREVRRAARGGRPVPAPRARPRGARSSAAAGVVGAAAVRPGRRQPREQLAQSRQLGARVAAEEELVDVGEVALARLAQLRGARRASASRRTRAGPRRTSPCTRSRSARARRAGA